MTIMESLLEQVKDDENVEDRRLPLREDGEDMLPMSYTMLASPSISNWDISVSVGAVNCP